MNNLNDIRQIVVSHQDYSVNQASCPSYTLPKGNWLFIGNVMSNNHTWIHLMPNGTMDIYPNSCNAANYAIASFNSNTSFKLTADSYPIATLRVRLYAIPVK